MSQRIIRSSWSVEPHSSWSVIDDPECLTFTKSNASGALQLSSAIKEIGVITPKEVEEFATENVELMGNPSPIQFSEFSGFMVAYSENGTSWRRYWLARGNILVFVTHNGSSSNIESETPEVLQMLDSLRLTPCSA